MKTIDNLELQWYKYNYNIRKLHDTYSDCYCERGTIDSYIRSFEFNIEETNLHNSFYKLIKDTFGENINIDHSYDKSIKDYAKSTFVGLGMEISSDNKIIRYFRKPFYTAWINKEVLKEDPKAYYLQNINKIEKLLRTQKLI